MSIDISSGKVVLVDKEAYSDPGAADTQERLVPSSGQMTVAKVEANVPDSDLTYRGLTLEQEERARAREAEKERTRWARSVDDRERRTRRQVTECTEDPDWFETPELKAVDWMLREEIESEAERIHEETDSVWTVKAIAKRFLAHLQGETGEIPNVDRRGKGWTEALFAPLDDVKQWAAGTVPIEAVPTVDRQSVDVEGEVVQLWNPSHRKIQQVGLVEDDTGKIKFTVWRKSRQPTVREGERVRFRDVKRNWYRGRCSIALTGDSIV